HLLEHFQPFDAQPEFGRYEAGRVATRPRQALHDAHADRIGHAHEHDRHASGRLLQRHRWRRPVGQDDVGRERDQFGRVPADAIVVRAQALVDWQVAALVPTELAQRLLEGREASYGVWIVIHRIDEHADPPYPVRLLRPRIERPRDCRAADERDELAASYSYHFQARQIGTFCTESVWDASSQTLWIRHSFAFHSITSSARASSVAGTSRPSNLAVCRLMTSSNLVACTVGKSPGLAPLRMRPA